MAIPPSGWRIYSYLLIVVALLSAFTRLRRGRASAEAQSAKLENPRVRQNQRLQAMVIVTAAAVLTAFWFLHIGAPWLWVAAVVAALSGTQSLLELVMRTPAQLLLLARMFGVLFAGVALLLYFMFVR